MAYGVLRDPVRRARYDSGQLTVPVRPPAPPPPVTIVAPPPAPAPAPAGRLHLTRRAARWAVWSGIAFDRARRRRRRLGGLAPASRLRAAPARGRRGGDGRRRGRRATARVHDPRRAHRCTRSSRSRAGRSNPRSARSVAIHYDRNDPTSIVTDTSHTARDVTLWIVAVKLFVGGIVLLLVGIRRLRREPAATRSDKSGSPTYAVICIVFRMAYRAAVVGGSGYTGAELLRLLAGPSRDRGGAGHRRLERRRRRCRELFPSLAAAYPSLVYAPLEAADLAGLDVVFLGVAARGVAGRSPDRSSTPSATSSTSAPTSGSRAPTTSSGTARRTPRRSCSTGSRSACPSCTAPTSRAAPPRRRARLLPDRPRRSRWRRCCATGSSSRRASWSTRCRACPARGAARRSRACSPRRTRTSPRTASSRIATPPRWRWRSRTSPAQPVQVLFTPHLVPMTRGILATCYARPAVDGLSTAELLDALPRVLRRRAVRRRHRRVAGHEGHARLEHRARHRALRRAHDTVLAIGALDNLVKGASGQAIQGANLRARPARDHRRSRSPGLMP